ncbi:MAG: PAS domain S-box protein [Kofleriaceae bacterium]
MSARAEIAVVGGADGDRRALVAQLGAAGLGALGAATLRVDREVEAPELLIVVGADADQLVRGARELPALAEVPILAVVPGVPATAATSALSAGAADIATLPLAPGVLAARCRNLLRLGRSRRAGALAPALSRVNELLAQRGDDAEALSASLAVAAEALGFDRAALIAHLDGSEHGYVIAATDAPSRSQFTLLMSEYPEVVHAMRTGQAVLIDDATSDPLTASVAAKVAERGVRGLAVFPVLWRGRPLGAMLLRRDAPGVGHVGDRGLELGRLIAATMAAHLRHGAVLQSLQDQTHRISRARYEAERRLRGIDSLKEHFDAGADGVVVLDDAGRMLFVNRAAERITGFARDGLVGGELADLVDVEQRPLVIDAIARVLGGANLDPFDLRVATTTGSPIWASVSTSTVLADTGAVILTFRDVTAERALETELRSTKEFLERLIDSTVDAIIAADLRGNVILFNQGAERLFGYAAEDVLGQLPVWELYEQGVARQIMRMLRSTSYGGVGRLEQTRREIRTATGEIVPVSLTASFVYEADAGGSREVATVGILTDLRERIRMEQRLLQAQQKLQLTERQAVIAELAGATAHELNQPLTSIMGYAQLIQRQSAADAPHLRAVGVILSEAERMATIVKKIGRITKYETTDYVGTARIMDLDRSVASDPGIDVPAPPPPAGAFDGDDEHRTREFAMLPDAVDLRTVGDLRELERDPTKDGPR